MELILHFIREMWFFFSEIAIYLIFGFFVAGVLHVIFPERLIDRHLGQDNFKSVLKATLFGIPLPLCSCGVIPVAASLRKKGASKGAALSFLIATPQIGADSFMITYSLIGWIFAVFRILAAFITAFFSGLMMNLFSKKIKARGSAESIVKDKSTVMDRLKSMLSYIQYELLGSFANYLMVGILIAAAISAFVPKSFFETYLGNPLLSMLLMLVIGIPMYVCATASTPIAASLLMKGISPGAALVFLLAGPATNAVTISTVAKTMGKKAVAIYLAAISVVSIGMGYLLNFLVMEKSWQLMHHHEHSMLPRWLEILGVVLLGGMLVWHYLQRYVLPKLKKEAKMAENTIELKVDGMTCQHCAMTVKNAVAAVTGDEKAVVDLDANSVRFNYDVTLLDRVKQAIAERGYEVVNSSKSR